ncbi:hypothetical protein [Micromonospora orduensis]|uniref:hypothetical protein n=1 Tax=Micromonospora orduensis TaxID=1420891 RepID=UPI003640823D
MHAKDACAVRFIGIEYGHPDLSGRTLPSHLWNPQKLGSHSAVTNLHDKRDGVVAGDTAWQFLNMKSSPLSVVPVHGQFRGLRLLCKKQGRAG